MKPSRTLVRLVVALCTLSAVVTLGGEAKTKEEAQAEVDKGKTKSCEVMKKTLNPKCTEEVEKAKALDCAAPRSFKLDDVLGLSSSCASKLRAGAAAVGAASATSSGKKDEVRCKALDASGAVAAEDTDTSSIKCQRKVKDALTKKCDGSTKKLQFQFVGQVLGKDTRPTGLTVYCPKPDAK